MWVEGQVAKVVRVWGNKQAMPLSAGRTFQIEETVSAKAQRQAFPGFCKCVPVWLEQSSMGGERDRRQVGVVTGPDHGGPCGPL